MTPRTQSFSAAWSLIATTTRSMYDFNAAQMPVRVEVMRTRARSTSPPRPTSPASSPGRITTTRTSPCCGSFPRATASNAPTRTASISGFSGLYNRRVGLLAQPHGLSGQFLRHPAPCAAAAAADRAKLTETFFYEPIFNQLCARSSAAGNPINGVGRLFPAAELRHGASARGTPRSPISITRKTMGHGQRRRDLANASGPERHADRISLLVRQHPDEHARA